MGGNIRFREQFSNLVDRAIKINLTGYTSHHYYIFRYNDQINVLQKDQAV